MKNIFKTLKVAASVAATSNEKTFLSVKDKLVAATVRLTTVLFTATVLVALVTSCAPPLDLTDYDWDVVNAAKDPARNSGEVARNFTPRASINAVDVGTGTDEYKIVAIEVAIVFPGEADILRDTITKDTLDFITFRTFTKAVDFGTVDTLLTAIPFTVGLRVGNIVRVNLTPSPGIDTGATFSNLIMRVDAKKYTYAQGLRLDIDQNGKIEDLYDDWYVQEIALDTYNYGIGTLITDYVGLGQLPVVLSLPDVIDVNISLEGAGHTTSATYNDFFFADNAETTNTNSWYVEIIDNTTQLTNLELAFYKDMLEVLAAGIKLQELNGGSWSEKAAASYDAATVSDSAGIIFKGVSFKHQTAYRVIWTGSAYTQTNNKYYGVNQRVYIDDAGDPTGALRYTRTEVVTSPVTVNNDNLLAFIPGGSEILAFIEFSMANFNVDGRNNVLKAKIVDGGSDQYFWNEITADKFKESFKIVYPFSDPSPEHSFDGNPRVDLIEVVIKDISYGRETDTTTTGNNVLYITLDPNFRLPSSFRLPSGTDNPSDNFNAVNAEALVSLAHIRWESDKEEYEAARENFNDDTIEWEAYQTNQAEWTNWQAYISSVFYEDLEDWDEDGGDPRPDPNNTGYTDQWPTWPNEPTQPTVLLPFPSFGSEPQIEDYWDGYWDYNDYASSTLGGIGSINYPNSGNEPPQASQEPIYKRLYIRANNGVGITNNLTGAGLESYVFGTADALYENFEFYGPL